MLLLLDKIYFRVKSAIRVFMNPGLVFEEFMDGYRAGASSAHGRIRRALDASDPYEFSNKHFKLGYYYAFDAVKTIIDDESSSVHPEAKQK